MKSFALIVLLVLSVNATADIVIADQATITQIVTYSEQNGFDGDLFILLDAHPAGCPGGFWLRQADTSGYRNTVSILLSAFHAGTKVRIVGYNDPPNVWTGNSWTTCRTDQVHIVK